MVSRSRWGQISHCAWTLCTSLGKWYVAQDKKIVVSGDYFSQMCAIYYFPRPVHKVHERRLLSSNIALHTIFLDWYTKSMHGDYAHDGEKVVSIHGLCVLM
jgi:hypothetical protein